MNPGSAYLFRDFFIYRYYLYWGASMVHSPSVEEEFWQQVLSLIVRPQSLQDLLRQLVTQVIQLFNADYGAVYLFDHRTDELVFQVQQGEQGGYSPTPRLRRGQGITGMAAFQRKLLQAAHIQDDPCAILNSGAYHYESIVAVPLSARDDLLGVFNLQSRVERHFSAAEMRFLEKVIQKVFVAGICAARTLQDMHRRTNQIQALNELGQAMNSGLDLDESLELIASKAAEALNAKGSAIRLLVKDGSLAQAIVFTVDGVTVESIHERRIAEYVAASGEPIQIDDLRTDRDPQPQALGDSLICVPLVLEDRVVGTLALFDKAASPEDGDGYLPLTI
jgi:GAF domain-containing protein